MYANEPKGLKLINNNNSSLSGLSVQDRRLVVVILLDISEKEEGVVAARPIVPLKTRSGLEPVPRCEPCTYQPISRWHSRYM